MELVNERGRSLTILQAGVDSASLRAQIIIAFKSKSN